MWSLIFRKTAGKLFDYLKTSGNRFASFGRQLVADFGAFVESSHTGGLNSRNMNEDVITAFIRGDEAITFLLLNHFTVPVAITLSFSQTG